MIKQAITFLFATLSILAYSQDTSQVNVQKNSRILIGINFSPDYCQGIFKAGFTNTNHFKGVPKFGFTSGFNLCYAFKKHLSIETGFQYSNKVDQIKTTGLNFVDFIDNTGFVHTSPIEKVEYNFYYMDIPLKVNFIYSKKRMRFIGSIGLAANILIKAVNTFFVQESPTNTFKSSITVPDNYRMNISYTISCGIDYKINNRMFFRVEPTFRYGSYIISAELIKQYIWNAGLNISYYFGL
jgi:hypothetical protein